MLKIKTVCRVLYLLVMYSQSTSASQPSHSEKERYINFDKEGNYTAAAGANFIVKCRSNTPISLTHRWPKNATDEELGVYVDEDEITRIYTAQLTLTDLTYKDVGWFDCIEITSLGLPKIVSFYLFVDDPEHLIAGPRVTRISAKGFLPVVIPCLPTAPDVYVNLLTEDGYPMGFSTDQKREDKDWFYYHPTRGFIMPRTLATESWYIFKCEFTKRGVKQRNNINVLLNGGVQSNFVYLERQGGTKTSEVSAMTGSDVLFAAEVFSNYKPTIHWYDKENHEIKTDKKFTVAHILGEPWETRLIIHNVSSTDAGLYTAREGSKKEISFKLHVRDIQTLDIEMEKVFFVSNDNFGAFCRDTPSRPIQNLTWTIRRHNCQLQEGCVETLSSLKTHQDVDDIEFNPKFPHAILFNKPMLANITCAMKYLDGTEHSVTRPLIVSEAKDGFETEQKYDISAKTVALMCTVSRFLYSGHLYWIGHDGFVIEKNRTEDGRNITVTRSETFYSYRVTLTIAMKANYTPPVEVYRCMAVDYQHVPSLKSHELDINAGIAPYFYADSIYNRSMFLMVGDEILLNCRANGVPSPTVHWYKDDMKIETDGHYSLNLRLQMNDSGHYSCRATNDYGQVYLYKDITVYNAADGWNLQGRVSKRVILLCYDDGEPAHNYTWFRNDNKVYESTSITIGNNGTILSIFPVKAQDVGFYTCKASGQNHKKLRIVEYSPTLLAPILGSIFVIVLIFAIIYILMRIRRLHILKTPISFQNLLANEI